MKVAYIDTHSGVAGDMLLASLIDAGVDLEELKLQLNTIKEIKDEWDLSVSKASRSEGQITGKYITVHSIHNHKPLPPPTPIESGICDTNDASSSHHSHSHSHGHSHGHEHNHSDKNTECDESTHNHNHGSPTTTVATNSIVDKNTSIPPTISEDEARNREANASAAAATAAVLKQSEEMNEMKSMIQELQQQILEEPLLLTDLWLTCSNIAELILILGTGRKYLKMTY